MRFRCERTDGQDAGLGSRRADDRRGRLRSDAAVGAGHLLPRARKIYLDERDTIENELRHRDLEYGEALESYLDAGLATGLRPHEWSHARLVKTDTCAALVVANAKRGNERAHGPFRRQLWPLSDAAREVNLIERQISMVRARLVGVPWGAREEAMKVLNRALEDTLRQVQRDLSGRSISEYWPVLG